MTMLSAQQKLQIIGINQGLHAADICKRCMNADINSRKVILANEVRQFLQALNCLVVVLIHFPVTAN